MRAPDFWRHGGARWPARLLSPAAAAYAAVTAHRVARPRWQAPVPVLCVGNAGVGGAGKTPVAIALAERLRARGLAVHLLARGYGGRLRGPLRVDPACHTAADVGDEPLLLAAVAPCWIGADRATAARAAIAGGAQALVLDDGLQSPGLAHTLALLVIDGGAGFGNGRVLPAGPLREPAAAALARVQAAVLIGEDSERVAAELPVPVLRAALEPAPEAAALAGRRVLAFAGIGRPAKFFAMLTALGADLAGTRAFPDHHPFTEAELRSLAAAAQAAGALAVCTPKDHVRLPSAWRPMFTPASAVLRFADEAAIGRLLQGALA